MFFSCHARLLQLLVGWRKLCLNWINQRSRQVKSSCLILSLFVSSGQTYERFCIEKWYNDGHSTCPKAQQQLSHLCLTPNYCVKRLIVSWCERNGFPIPNGPPESLDVNYWRLAFSKCQAINTNSFGYTSSCKLKYDKVLPLEENLNREELRENDAESLDNHYHDCGLDEFEKYGSLLSALHEAESAQKQFRIVEQIKNLLKEDDEARIFMGTNGAVEVLIQFLRMAVHIGDEKAQEAGAMALFNLMVNSNRNKGLMIAAGLIPLLEQMFSNSDMYKCVVTLYLRLSCLDEAKPLIGSSMAVPFLIQVLRDHNIERSSCKYFALYNLYNLSTHLPNIPSLVSSDIINSLHPFLGFPSASEVVMLAEKALAILINLAASRAGRKEITSAPSIFRGLAGVLDFGESTEQEQAVSCLLILCSGDERCSQMVLQEGVMPSLVSISVNGTTKGKEKTENLLKLFREQRQQEPSTLKQQPQQVEKNGGCEMIVEWKTLSSGGH
ncbi:hypothetical protein BHE74_00035244 [Ensete ventricosum]|nr:hypothetical protein BHE74_00035244 [Ensete ventricosum]